MKKCLIALLLSVMLLISVFPVSAASDSAVLAINCPQELPKTGEKIEITVDISNNPGICAVQFTLSYDKNIFECEEAKLGGVLRGMPSAINKDSQSGIVVAVANASAVYDNGTLFKCVFLAKEDAEKLDFSLKDVSLLDSDRNDIDYTADGSDEETEEPDIPDIPDEPETPSKPTRPGGSSSVEEEQPKEDIKEEQPNEETEEVSFPDVSDHWAKEFVNKAAKLGLFKGDTAGNFNPDAPVTRAQFVTVLWRMAGKTEVTEETPFEDIETQIDEFKSAIAWGYKNGYINGTSETTFDPNGTLTREAGMKILHFYSGGKSGGEIMLTGVYDGTFKDSKAISVWAKPSMYWGIYNKLISGVSVDALAPQGTATRAQLAKILVNYIDTYNN